MLRKLLAAGQLDPDAETVIINSGDGLKTLVRGGVIGYRPSAIKPTIEDFERRLTDG